MSTAASALYTGRIFPGLRPFEDKEALLFFGREEQTDELLRRLDDTRLLAVVGLSGSGKSSLVKAGLLPALRRGHLNVAGSRWHIAMMRPGSDPLGALANELNNSLGERDDRLAMLRSGDLGLLDAGRLGRGPDENLLLVVDQFEEIFRFHRGEEAAEFMRLLLAAVEEYEPEYRVYVVITMRSDYLGDCARFPGLPEALNESQYLVPRMTKEQLREAVEGPSALGGVEVQPDLLRRLLEKTGDDPDQLPVLQHLLMRMWEVREQTETGAKITQKEYDHPSVGGWENALNRHADKVFDDLPADRQLIACCIFKRLTEKGEASRESRRPTKLGELAAVAEAKEEEVKTVVKHFREEGCNFLTSPDRELTGDSVIDISHESLIRRWKRLGQWAEEEADWGEWYRRVEDRRGIKGAHLVDPELESALQARKHGCWNEVWAERYATEKDGRKLAYGDVVDFLEESKRRRSAELERLRHTRALTAAAAVLFAVLAIAASYFGWSAGEARARTESLRLVSTWQLLALQAVSDSGSRVDDGRTALLARQAWLFHGRRPEQPTHLVEEALQRSVRVRPFSNVLHGHQGPCEVGGLLARRPAPRLRQLRQDGAAVGPRPARARARAPRARRPSGPCVFGGLLARRPAPRLRRLRQDGAAVGPRPARGRAAGAGRPSGQCGIGGLLARRPAPRLRQ